MQVRSRSAKLNSDLDGMNRIVPAQKMRGESWNRSCICSAMRGRNYFRTSLRAEGCEQLWVAMSVLSPMTLRADDVEALSPPRSTAWWSKRSSNAQRASRRR